MRWSSFPAPWTHSAPPLQFQQAVTEANRDQPEDTRIVFRIGLHLGDLIVEGDDLYGDGVNVAARLEAEAPPGGIVVSRAIREAVEGRLKAKLHALGELALKNIERPIRAFRVEWDAADWKTMGADAPKPAIPAEPTTSTLALPDKPSIAVLPFQNMSGDPEQEYFADGMVEDIITALSRFKSLFVIARNSSFTYKGKAVDIKQVGRELGVRYVLEGSVRKAGNRMRITGQLIDATTRRPYVGGPVRRRARRRLRTSGPGHVQRGRCRFVEARSGRNSESGHESRSATLTPTTFSFVEWPRWRKPIRERSMTRCACSTRRSTRPGFSYSLCHGGPMLWVP